MTFFREIFDQISNLFDSNSCEKSYKKLIHTSSQTFVFDMFYQILLSLVSHQQKSGLFRAKQSK